MKRTFSVDGKVPKPIRMKSPLSVGGDCWSPACALETAQRRDRDVTPARRGTDGSSRGAGAWAEKGASLEPITDSGEKTTNE